MGLGVGSRGAMPTLSVDIWGSISFSKRVTFYKFKVNELIEVFTLVLKTSFKVKHGFYY